MKYERLTEIEDNAIGMSCEISDIIDRLCELEDKIEDGTLLELPCKVGDTIYYVYYDYPFEGKVVGIAIEINATWLNVKYEGGLNMWHTVDDIGKTIFLTKAEAEKRLEELQKEDDYEDFRAMALGYDEFRLPQKN